MENSILTESMLIVFFDNKETDIKEIVLAGQTENSAYYCDVLRSLRENVRRLRPGLWRQQNWLLHHNAPCHTSFFTRKFFTKNNMIVVSHPPPSDFSLFPRFKTKLKGSHFGTSEVIEAQ
jgi:hypothetical protein